MKPEESKEKYLKFQMMQQQMMQLQKQLEELTHQKNELNLTIKSIKDFSNTEGERKLLTPLASGIFMKSKINTFDEVLVNVGNGIIVKKSPKEAIKLVEKHLGDIEKVIEQINQSLIQFDQEFVNLQKELEVQNV